MNEREALFNEVASDIHRLAAIFTLLGPRVECIHDPVLGTAECDAYIADHDAGDEDPAEWRRPRWTATIRLLDPVVVPRAIHYITIEGEVSV